MLGKKIILLIGIVLVMALYFWGHNVGASSEILRGGLLTTVKIAGDLGIVAVLITLTGGLGRRVLSMVDFTAISLGERLVLETMIGLGIVSLLAVTLGLLGQFNLIIWGVLLLSLIVTFRSLLSYLGDWRSLLFSNEQIRTPWEGFIRVFVLVMLLAALLLALAPPFAWDAINYHLVVPQRYIAAGSIGQHLDNHFFGFQQNIEMLYGLLMMLGSDRAPTVLHFAIATMGLIAIYNLVQRHSSRKAAATSVLLLMASFNLWQLFSWAYVDLALMTYGVVAVIAIYQWTQAEKNPQHWLGLAAVAASLAAGIKYTAAPLILGLYILILLREPKNIIRNTLIFGGFGVLIFLPWMVKGLLLYENPIYPYIFNGPNWDDVRAVNFSEVGTGLIGRGLWLHIPTLPFAATIFGIDKVTPYRFTLSPFLLTLPFLLFISWNNLPEKARQLGKTVLPLAIVVLLYWMLVAAMTNIGAQTRLMLVAIPLAAILCGLAFHSVEQWLRRPLDMVFILQAAIILSVFFGMFDFINYFAHSRVLEYHATVLNEDSYLRLGNNAGALYDAMLALEDLPADSHVLFLWEPKTYYCPDDMTCVGDLLFDNWSRPLQMGASPEGLIEQWQSDYDYVLIFDVNTGNVDTSDGYSRWIWIHDFAVAENELFPQFFYDNVTTLWSDDIAYTIYEWQD